MKSRRILAGIIVCMLAMTACGNKDVSNVEEVTSNVEQDVVESDINESDSTQEEGTEVESTQEEEVQELETYYAVVFTGTEEASIDAIKAIRSVTDYELEEAKAIADQPSAIIKLFNSEDDAKNAIETLNAEGVNAEISEVKGNFEIDNIFRIERAFSLSDRGTAVIGVNYSGVMKQDQVVYHIKKDGTAVQAQITFIEAAPNMVEETVPGTSYGIGVPVLEKENIEAGDILIAFDAGEENENELPTDFYGAYNGEPIIANDGSVDFESILQVFVNDGWKADPENFENSNVVNLGDQNQLSGVTLMNLPTMKSYIVGVYKEAGDNKPNMSWSGVTWGASLEEIEEKYGTPVSQEEGMYADSYTFQIEDGVTIQFDISKETQSEPGLSGVTVTFEK